MRSITYDINDLYRYIDSLPDLSALVYSSSALTHQCWAAPTPSAPHATLAAPAAPAAARSRRSQRTRHALCGCQSEGGTLALTRLLRLGCLPAARQDVDQADRVQPPEAASSVNGNRLRPKRPHTASSPLAAPEHALRASCGETVTPYVFTRPSEPPAPLPASPPPQQHSPAPPPHSAPGPLQPRSSPPGTPPPSPAPPAPREPSASLRRARC